MRHYALPCASVARQWIKIQCANCDSIHFVDITSIAVTENDTRFIVDSVRSLSDINLW